MAGARPLKSVRGTKPDGFELVEARHLDAFTEAVRTLNATNTRAEIARAKDEKARAIREERQLAVLEAIAEHTKNLPALVELMTARTNGASHHEEHADGRPDPR